DISGPTHHSLEDLAIMRLLPNVMVFSPSDWVVASSYLDVLIKCKKPKYIRLDGKPVDRIYQTLSPADIDNGFCALKEGKDVCLATTGYMTHKALRIARGNPALKIGVVDIFALKPVNGGNLCKALSRYKHVITIEEGFINNGGLDTLISVTLRDGKSNTEVKSLGFADKYMFRPGNREHLHSLAGLDEKNIIQIVNEVIS
ncbi:MAG: transketolase C-terminal domain-containing protein, partial [Candidatus Omnitrophica bacterium]|nr:transketolase C-terminal domain-containing protein [Candidatus Omnitrophota bacterium]